MRLTAKERILLHLLDFVKQGEAAEVPLAMSRDGLAAASWIDVRHVPQSVRPLIREGLVSERVSHVKGGSRRRKTYVLSESGVRVASRLREAVMDETVQVRDAAGIRNSTVSDILRDSAGARSLLDVIHESVSHGTVDLTVRAHVPVRTETVRPSEGFVEMLQNAPRVDGFVGRRKELELITGEDGPRIVVVRGVAGIGKSSLAAKACQLLRGRKHLFWRQVRPWDTSHSFLASLADFLGAVGKPDLRSVLARGDDAPARRVLRDELIGSNALLVFDDAHEAVPGVVSVFRDLKDALDVAHNVRLLVLTRRRVPFYDRRDVELKKTLAELDLRGLGIEDLQALIPPAGETVALLNIGRKLGGHPLLIELARSASRPATAARYLQDAERFLDEEVYAELSEPERRMMKLASLYRSPVPREALFQDPALTHDVLLSLLEKSLIRRAGGRAFEAHETIRDYFECLLTPDEKAILAPFAVAQLRTLAAQAEHDGNGPACIDHLSNAVRLSPSAEETPSLLEALGDASQRIGDLPAALHAFKEGLALTQEPVTIARLHRKVAGALLVRGDEASATREVDQGLHALGSSRSVERGWLELLRSQMGGPDVLDDDLARSSARTAIEVFHEYDEKHGEAEALGALGYILMHEPEGDPVEAERVLRTGLEVAVSASDRRLVAEAHGNLFHLYALHRGDVEEAILHLSAEEASARDQDYLTRSNAIFWKGVAQAELLRDYAQAETTLNEMVALARRTYDPLGSLLGRFQLANVAFYRGDLAGARRVSEELWEEGRAGNEYGFKWAMLSLAMAAECCFLLADREGFERLVAESSRPEVRDRITDRFVVADVLQGLSAFIHGDARKFHSSFSHGMEAAERAFKIQEAPFQFRSFLVPYFYGVALRAHDQEEEGAAQISHALAILQSFKMRAQFDVLLRDQDRLVRQLREWAGQAVRESAGDT